MLRDKVHALRSQRDLLAPDSVTEYPRSLCACLHIVVRVWQNDDTHSGWTP